MGIGRFLKSLVNSEVLGEEIIATQEKLYARFKTRIPSAEPHLLLAYIWLSRTATNGLNTEDEDVLLLSFSETLTFACIQPPNNVRALGIYFIYKERPDIYKAYPRFQIEFNALMLPVFEAKKNDNLKNLYQRNNPEIVEFPHSYTANPTLNNILALAVSTMDTSPFNAEDGSDLDLDFNLDLDLDFDDDEGET